MNPYFQQIVTVLVTFIASSGLWSLIMYKVQKHDSENNAIDDMSHAFPKMHEELQEHTDSLAKLEDMLKGMGHNAIISEGKKYLAQGFIDPDDFDDLYQGLYLPYKALGGNGTAKKIVIEVAELPTIEGGNKTNKQRIIDELN